MLIEQDLSVPGHREIFVIGDMSALTDASGTPVPGLGAAAVQEGKAAAENILRDLRGNARLSFIYQDWGILATIGHHRAVAQFGHRTFSGFIAWLLWALVHIVLLIGFRNRVAVMSQWVWAYLTRQGSSPLITEHQRRKCDVHRAQDPPTPAREQPYARVWTKRRASHKKMTMSGRRTTQPRDERRLQEDREPTDQASKPRANMTQKPGKTIGTHL